MNGKTGILNETLLIRHDILQLSVSILIRRLFVLMKVSKKVWKQVTGIELNFYLVDSDSGALSD